MAKQLSTAQVNHLRRLLGWVRCDIGQSPEEVVETVKTIVGKIGPLNDYGKNAMVKHYEQSARIPKYIRAAIKALEPIVRDADGQIVDSESKRQRMIGNQSETAEKS